MKGAPRERTKNEKARGKCGKVSEKLMRWRERKEGRKKEKDKR
jgi:hypothetical protein